MKAHWALMMLVASVGATACGDRGVVWTESYSFPGEEWSSENRLAFAPDSASIAGAMCHMAEISFRYAADAPLDRFTVVAYTENPASGAYRSDTLQVALLPVDCRPAEKGKLGIFETSVVLPLEEAPAPEWELTAYPIGGTIKGLFSITIELK